MAHESTTIPPCSNQPAKVVLGNLEDGERRGLREELSATFTVLTRWASMDAVTAFTGSDPTRAVVEPSAVEALPNFDH